MENIKDNHKEFEKATEACDKLSIAAKNLSIQFKNLTKSISEFKEICDFAGYEFDINTGELTKSQQNT